MHISVLVRSFCILLIFGLIKATPVQSVQTPNRIQYELPQIMPEDEIVKHFAYTINYSEQNEQAQWAAYMLTKKMINNTYPRTNSFRIDPKVPTVSASPKDYVNSAYDKGHLVPCDDMRWSKKAESESFFMSNMSPQLHSFNAGKWKSLESWVHKYANTFDTIYIVAGPILQDNLKKIKKTIISIPEYFYKVILEYKYNEKKCIGFILPHKKITNDFWNYAVTVDSVEKRTGINFFFAIPDSIQKTIESQIDKGAWGKRHL